MKIELLEIAGFASAIKAMRLPMRSGDKSDSLWTINQTDWIQTINGGVRSDSKSLVYIGPNDLKLSQKLILSGDEHAKCLRGIVAWVEVTGPWYWFNELDTYTIGRTPMSSTSSMHIDCKGLTGEELQKSKGAIRGDYEYTRVFNVTYQTARRMWIQRHPHRLPEWREWCVFLESLPLAKELITYRKGVNE